MNILLVDDEKLAVDVIRKTIPMSLHGIEEVYGAYSMKQAIEVLESHSVSILICDIQMPKGSGLDLADWIREQGLDVEIIFLTSHALFSYAQEAIRLNAGAYLLKPVKRQELERAICDAVERIQIKNQTEQNQRYARYWTSSQVTLQQDFWRKCISSQVEESSEHMNSRAKKAGISMDDHASCYPILAEWKKKEDMGKAWSPEVLGFTVRNIISEMLFQRPEIGNVIEMGETRILIFYPIHGETELMMQEKCRMVLDSCREYLTFCSVTLYVKEVVPLERVKQTAEYILEEARQDAVKKEGVILLNQKKERSAYEKPDMAQWVRDMFEGHYQRTAQKSREFLGELGRRGKVDTTILRCLQQDFLQELYIEMGRHGIRANIIFSDENMRKSFAQADASVDSFLQWILCIGAFLSEYDYGNDKMPSVIRKVKQYIEDHVGEEISRNDLASKVYLHPDYMNRLFKEQVGTSVSDYVIQMRLAKAKVMLRTTQESISSIAAMVGYPNTAYFTKIFKRSVGVTPKEYRKEQEAP